MLNLHLRGLGNLFHFKKWTSLSSIHSQYFHLIYDLIRPCKVSIISLKDVSLDIFSSTFLME